MRKQSQIPTYIRAVQVDLASSDRDYIRRKLGTRLGKFARSIERVSVRMEDANGPRGGVDQLCRIKVVLRGLPSVVLSAATQRSTPPSTVLCQEWSGQCDAHCSAGA